MLASALTGIRLSLHILAATIWIGGQITFGGLLPQLRVAHQSSAVIAMKTFKKFAWPAYGVLIITGLWNYSSFNMNRVSTAWKVVVGIKITVALFAGLAEYLHQRATTTKGIAVWGSIVGTSSVAALVLGVFLAG